MYFPDLESVKRVANLMTRNPGEKKYNGLVPASVEDLPQARKELGRYFREVWKDEIQALEVELAVTKEDYEEKLASAFESRFEELDQPNGRSGSV